MDKTQQRVATLRQSLLPAFTALEKTQREAAAATAAPTTQASRVKKPQEVLPMTKPENYYLSRAKTTINGIQADPPMLFAELESKESEFKVDLLEVKWDLIYKTIVEYYINGVDKTLKFDDNTNSIADLQKFIIEVRNEIDGKNSNEILRILSGKETELRSQLVDAKFELAKATFELAQANFLVKLDFNNAQNHLIPLYNYYYKESLKEHLTMKKLHEVDLKKLEETIIHLNNMENINMENIEKIEDYKYTKVKKEISIEVEQKMIDFVKTKLIDVFNHTNHDIKGLENKIIENFDNDEAAAAAAASVAKKDAQKFQQEQEELRRRAPVVAETMEWGLVPEEPRSYGNSNSNSNSNSNNDNELGRSPMTLAERQLAELLRFHGIDRYGRDVVGGWRTPRTVALARAAAEGRLDEVLRVQLYGRLRQQLYGRQGQQR